MIPDPSLDHYLFGAEYLPNTSNLNTYYNYTEQNKLRITEDGLISLTSLFSIYLNSLVIKALLCEEDNLYQLCINNDQYVKLHIKTSFIQLI